MSVLSEPHFHNEEAAIARLEAIVWPDGPYCPKCGGFDRITPVKGGRLGLRRCGPCKREFTVTVGTIFERSHVKLHILQNRLVHGTSPSRSNARRSFHDGR
jgi:transposase-like protein